MSIITDYNHIKIITFLLTNPNAYYILINVKIFLLRGDTYRDIHAAGSRTIKEAGLL